jgi:hypothetical protein
MVAHNFTKVLGSFRIFMLTENGIDHFIIQMFCFYQFEDINRGEEY